LFISLVEVNANIAAMQNLLTLYITFYCKLHFQLHFLLLLRFAYRAGINFGDGKPAQNDKWHKVVKFAGLKPE
jgi:hypothetical protein